MNKKAREAFKKAQKASCCASTSGTIALLAGMKNSTIESITPNAKPHLTQIKGENASGFGFEARLGLWAIRDLINWPNYSGWFDYPEMVRQGDWSGVRDSSNESIENFYNEVILPQTQEEWRNY
jgi:hypothetical protein